MVAQGSHLGNVGSETSFFVCWPRWRSLKFFRLSAGKGPQLNSVFPRFLSFLVDSPAAKATVKAVDSRDNIFIKKEHHHGRCLDRFHAASSIALVLTLLFSAAPLLAHDTSWTFAARWIRPWTSKISSNLPFCESFYHR